MLGAGTLLQQSKFRKNTICLMLCSKAGGAVLS